VYNAALPADSKPEWLFWRAPDDERALSDHTRGDGMTEEVDPSRRQFLTAATLATGAIGTAFAIAPFIASWKPSARAKALGAPVEIDVSKLDPGAMMTVQWRKQPVWIVHRTKEMLDRLPENDPELKDPKSDDSDQPSYAHNEERARKPRYLVLLGTCTHLGCLPKQRFAVGVGEGGPDWPGGWFCVCHGSRFDMAGRVVQGSPAAVNLRVPPYDFINETRILVGEDKASKGAA
jgi:ubiquinol-cytochrome c reductase iron-sulfur subunit